MAKPSQEIQIFVQTIIYTFVCCLGGGSSALLHGGAPTPCSMAGGAGVLGGGAFCGIVLGRVRLTPYDGTLATRVRAEHRTPLRRARSRAPCWRGVLTDILQRGLLKNEPPTLSTQCGLSYLLSYLLIWASALCRF